MGETVLLVVLIVVLFLITVISIYAMVKLRRKTSGTSSESLDAGFDICIRELNKMGSLIKSDIDARYKEILFLYSLIEDKHKQIESLVSKDSIEELQEEKYIEPTSETATDLYDEVDISRSLLFDHKAIIQMNEQGYGIADIAKELGIGQGEVRLILNISNK